MLLRRSERRTTTKMKISKILNSTRIICNYSTHVCRRTETEHMKNKTFSFGVVLFAVLMPREDSLRWKNEYVRS